MANFILFFHNQCLHLPAQKWQILAVSMYEKSVFDLIICLMFHNLLNPLRLSTILSCVEGIQYVQHGSKAFHVFMTSLNFGSTLLTYLRPSNLQAHFTFIFIPYPIITDESVEYYQTLCENPIESII